MTRSYDSYLDRVDGEEALRFASFADLVETNDATDNDQIYNLALDSSKNFDSMTPLRAVNLIQARDFASEHGYDASLFEDKLDSYFESVDISDEVLELDRATLPGEISIKDIFSGLEYHAQKYEGDEREEAIKNYLYTISTETDLA